MQAMIEAKPTTQGAFERAQIQKFKDKYGAPLWDAIFQVKLRDQHGRASRALADTFQYFEHREAREIRDRQNALDVNRHERSDEYALRAIFGPDVDKTTMDMVREEMTRHDVKGGSKKSGKLRKDPKKHLRPRYEFSSSRLIG